MAPTNENPARAGGVARKKIDLADEADQAQSNPDRSELQAHPFDGPAEAPIFAEKELACIQLDWGPLSQRELGWFLRQRVTLDALLRPWPIGATKVRFDGHTFEPDPNGVRAITFAVIDYREVIDIAAWQPRTGQLASFQGQAFCLGDLDDLFNPAIYFDDGALRIHASPLEWLTANREGIVILRPDLTYAYLQHVRRLFFANARHLRQVRSWIQPPQPCAEFLIETPAEMAE